METRPNLTNAFSSYPPGNCRLPERFAQFRSYFKNFIVRDDDIWLSSVPKSGSTWSQEMIWLIAHNLDYEKAKSELTERFPFFEYNLMSVSQVTSNAEHCSNKLSWEHVNDLKSPRLINTHLPYNLLPDEMIGNEGKAKIIYVARNPKDTIVSYYHHKVLFNGYQGTMDDTVDDFIADRVVYSPYWTHIKEFWERRHEPNILFITYEEMKKDLPSVITKIAAFLGKTINQDEMKRLTHHLSFESMKGNPYVNKDEFTGKLISAHGVERKTNFIRKGKVGSWKEELSPNSIIKLDNWIRKNKIEGLWDDL